MFIYTSLSRCLLLVGVIFTLILSVVQRSYSEPLPPLRVNSNSDSEKTSEDGRQRVKQHLTKITRSDYYQILFFRLAALFAGIFLIFCLLMCLCSMCWCASWTMQWPGFALNQGTYSSTKTRSSRIKDSPPSYDVVLAYKEDELATSANNEEPPSYNEALLKMKACNGAS